MNNTLNIVEELCKKLKPIFGEKIERLYMNYLMADSKEDQYQIEKALHALFQKHVSSSLLNNDILLSPPTADQVAGDYPLGMVRYAHMSTFPCSLREQDWVRHVCVSGMSGSGKTNFALQIVGNFIFRKKPFLVFDWKKSFRPLLMLNKNIYCFTIGSKVANFKININQPPSNVEPKEWINLLCDVVTESFSANYGVHKILRETIDRAFDEFGVYDGSKNYPTWLHIKDRLERRAEDQKKGRQSEWIESALRIAEALTFGKFGETINSKESAFLVEELFERQVVFELNALNNYEKKFFSEFILTYIYKYKKANEVAKEDFAYAILVDEAHNVFLKQKTMFVREPVTEVVYREIREYGVGLICLDQHISKLSEVVVGNSATHVCFQQQLPSDLDTVSSLMNLKHEREWFMKIPVGHAIVKLAERYQDPFLIDVPLVQIKKIAVPDNRVQERTLGLLKQERRLQTFYGNVQEAELKKEVGKMHIAFNKADVGIDDEFALQQIQQKKILQDKMQKAVDEWSGARKRFLKNHLQGFIHDESIALFEHGYDLKQAKKHFMQIGFKKGDIDKAVPVGFKTFEKKFDPILKLHNSFSQLTQLDKLFLYFVQNNSQMGTAQIYQHLSLSVRKGDEIKRKLVDLGLLKIEERQTNNTRKQVLQIV
jgi:hypothetical protein